ncbi:melanophilin a isoform X1 [Colossoma macropomum]|uniref:melanophilin a isoform X1 n=1 Tax=Colossoma macropomum TaxID=42526 RepID=UPI0018649B3C|nr:melanophilin a isoform X1 [Colossoma macropomum]XP_036425692.1 melanophilin a isoform X1 [Colossoma macropomum]
MDKKLDLSRLTDEEAKHVWEVIQRDFDLRKKEEERLGTLRTKIEKEDTKRELLGSQSNLADSHCIHCLQPFKFLVNSRRQCLDCHLYTCKSCSRYSKKECGWVCDPCRMSRVLKIGTLGWYHDNVRSRFKRFGSAKVMRSLYKRLNEEGRRDDDTQSMPDVRNAYNGHDDDHMDATEAQRYKQIRKTKRLLSVHPMDLDMDEYGSHSRRQSMQYIQDERGLVRNDFEYTPDMYHHHQHHHRMNRRKSLDRFSRPDDGLYSEHRMVRARSLSKINSTLPQRSHYLDTSEEEDGYRFPVYQLPSRRRSRASSQENIHQNAPPINELNKRMSAIESLLNRLEEKMTIPHDQPAQPSASQLEEEKLKKKLDELMSDKALSSDEDEPKKLSQYKGSGVRGGLYGEQGPPAPLAQEAELSSSSDEMPTEAQKRSTAAALCDITTEVLRTLNATESAMTELAPSNPNDRPQLAGTDVKKADDAYRELEENVYLTAGKSFEMERRLRKIEQNAKNNYIGPVTDSELSELEDQLAVAAAKVQSTESEVSDIESKIAALSASGLSIDKAKKKASSIQQRRKFSQDIATNRAHF